MPITDDEFDAGERDGENAPADLETEKDLVLAFLSQRVGKAYTELEIIRGVDFGEARENDRYLGSLADGLLDATGDAVASAMVVGDVEDALDELVADGVVQTRDVTDEQGDTETYYRISD